MSLTEGAIQRFEALVLKGEKNRVTEVEGINYWNETHQPIVFNPRQGLLKLHTLASLDDYLKHNPENIDLSKQIIHVTDHKTVKVFEAFSGAHRVRTQVIHCEIPTRPSFNFDQFYNPEDFIIKLMTNFVPTDNLNKLLAIIGNLQCNKVQNYEDDGITQQATVKSGIALSAIAVIENPVILKPFRTFTEVEQPESPYVLRLSGGDEKKKPTCALFDSGGDVWKLQCIHAISKWIKERTQSFLVLA